MAEPADRALSALLDGLLEGRNLSEDEAGELLTALTRPQLAPVMAASLLIALRAKGVTASELRGFA
ncbi:MAG TPA: hypothetical protein VKT19_04015, partial [Steroidobacteraceae bacterium]|nr:hypothetical protein [Steroidobacteraceae bacterium]